MVIMDSLSQNDENILQELHDIVYKTGQQINCNFISKRFQLHISSAIELLDKFVTKHRPNGDLTVQYLLSEGDYTQGSDEVKLNRFRIVDESELESFKSMYKKPQSHIYAVARSNQFVQPECFLTFEQFILEPTDTNLRQLHNLSYISNPHISIRPARRDCIGKTLKYDTLDQNEQVKNEDKCDSMEIELTDKTPSKEVKEQMSPKKRHISKSDEPVKQYKRIRKLDSSEDEEENEKIKENLQSYNDQFEITKVQQRENKQSDRAVEVSPPAKLNDNSKPTQTVPKAGNKQSVLKFKTQTQTSITNFFKKPPQK